MSSHHEESEHPTPLFLDAIKEARRAYGVKAYPTAIEITTRSGCRIRIEVPPDLEPESLPETMASIRCSADCFIEVLQTILEVGHRMTRSELMKAMQAKDRTRAESTVCVALEDMQKLRIVDNRRDTSPAGYGCCGWT